LTTRVFSLGYAGLATITFTETLRYHMSEGGWSDATEGTMISIPEARWAGPSDTKWDIHFNEYEFWINANYNEETGLVFGHTLDDAYQSEELLDEFIEQHTDRSV